LLNVNYKEFYSFTLDDKPVKVYLFKRNKGIKIQDSNNGIVRLSNKTTLKSPLVEFKEGYIYELGVRDKEGKPVNPEDFIYVLEKGEAERDLFVVETFFNTLILFVEFDTFDKSVFEDDEARISYNRSILKAYNHFAAKYALAEGNGILDPIAAGGQSYNLSYSLRQAYFDKSGDLIDEDYLKTTNGLAFTRTSIVFERIGGHGIPGSDEQHIQNASATLKSSISKELSNEDSFLASALVELNKQNFKFALLEGFIAVEAIAEQFMSKKKKETNVPQKSLDDFSRETGIGYQTNIEIPLALGKVDETYKQLIDDLNRIRRLRNKIVHEGLSVDHAIASDGIHVCRAYVAFLQSKL
jgi:hypothetical protein